MASSTSRWMRTVAVACLGAISAVAAATSPSVSGGNCSSSSIPFPTLFGARFLNITASPVTNLNISTMQVGEVPTANLTGLNFCNVTVTYTHPGRNDTVNVNIWLPLTNWNGRFQGAGGAGLSTTTGPNVLAPAVAGNYSVAGTDGGHSAFNPDASTWALDSPGNVNLNLLQDFASTCLNDLAVIGKAVTTSFYGTAPKYSYWNGCSTGGRQGLMLAQRYPDAFDGILALSPAINWDRFIPAEYWPQFTMNQLNYYPTTCELSAITAAAIQACDDLDGVQDGIISLPGLCNYDASVLIGKSYTCNGTTYTFSEQATQIANAAWNGSHTPDGHRLWYGLNKDAVLSDGSLGLASTICTGNTSASCKGDPFTVTQEWFTYWVLTNPNATLTNLTHSQFAELSHQSHAQYASIIGTADPDLSAFKAAGGKMITWHGQADQLIFINGTVHYYDKVLKRDPHAQDFYRFFEAPGTMHCATGAGPYPQDILPVLEGWVEQGDAPQTLTAVNLTDPSVTRPLCPYPQVQVYTGGDFTCQ